MSEQNGNGQNNGADATKEQPQIIITVDNVNTFHLKLTASAPSLDYALNMLDQARRELDSQWRAEKAISLQDRLRQKQQDDALAASLRGKSFRP